MHYLLQGDASSPRGRLGICALALPEVLPFMFSVLFYLGAMFVLCHVELLNVGDAA
jgi:hypothetical protein